MRHNWFKCTNVLVTTSAMLILMLFAACGGSAPPEPVVVVKEVVKEVVVEKEVVKEVVKEVPKEVVVEKEVVKEVVVERVVVATPTVASQPPETQEPKGVLNIAYSQVGPPKFTPKVAGAPQTTINVATVWESMWHSDAQGETIPRLVKEWSASPDGMVWTLKLQEGVQFHKGKGEFTAKDLIFSMNNSVEEGTVRGRLVQTKLIFFAKEGGMRAVDDHTVEVDTSGSGPRFDLTWYATSALLTGAIQIASKNHVEALGQDKAAVEDAIGTGPWEHIEHKTSEVWRLAAVEDHWRKTPNFAELNIWEISEESTRVANFQAGKLDSMHMSLESLPVLKKIEGVKFMRLAGGGQTHINIHGQMYVDRPDLANPRNSDLPWISSNPDTASDEWDRARKVRQAMSISLDRQLIVDSLVSGEGIPNHVFGWMGFESRLGALKDTLVYKFDPERARQLLAEARYADGFEIDMALTTRPFPGTVQMGEVACTMWEEVGIRCSQTRSAMSAFRPKFVDRSWEGLNTHGLGPLPEPLVTYSSAMVTKGVINYGIEHPFLEEKITEALATFDPEARFQLQREIAQWVFDNAVILPMYQVNWVFPIGPRIDLWDMACCDARTLFDLEHIPHRR
jgi:peptide/nickel transport system substrate-binding protein